MVEIITVMQVEVGCMEHPLTCTYCKPVNSYVLEDGFHALQILATQPQPHAESKDAGSPH